MKKILTLCINLLLLVISDAVPVKLIAGNRRVVKKDGATHTISKYYVVPNDFDPNNVTSTKETLRSPYSKSLQSDEGHINEGQISEDQISEGQISKDQISEGQTSEDKTTDDQSDSKIDYNNNVGDFGIRIHEAEAKLRHEEENNSAESKDSVITSRRLEADDLGNLLVKPIIKSNKINHIVTDNESNVGYNTSDGFQNVISSIVENATQNSERSIEDEVNDDDTSLLSSFGTLVHENYARNLDSFWKLLKMYIDTTSDEDELLAKIERLSLLLNIFTFLYKDAILQMPTESIINSIVDLLQIPFVEKSKNYKDESKTNVFGGYSEECLRKCDNNRCKPQLDSNGTYLSEAGSREANDILELENPEDSNWVETSDELGSNEVTVSNKPDPDLYNLLSVLPTPTINYDNNDILEDSVLKQTSFGTTETISKTDDNNIPSIIESRMADDSEHLPWYIEDGANDDLSWHIKDTKSIKYPYRIIHKPITFHHTKKGGKVLLRPNQPRITSTVHTVDVQNTIEKPYQVYTYVVNPATSVYEIQNTREVKSNLPEISGNAFNIPTSNSVVKVLNNNKPSLSYFKSQFGLLNQPSNPQLKYTKHVSTTYDVSKKLTPSGVLFENSHDEPTNQHKHLVDFNTEIYTTKSQTNSDTEQKAPQHLFPNGPIYPHGFPLSNDPAPISVSTIADTSYKIPNFVNQFKNPNYYDSNININHNHQTNLHKDLISKAIKYTEYKGFDDDYNKPTSVYEKQTKISKVHYPSYTEVGDTYDEAKLVYDREINPQPDLFAKATSQSEFTEVENDSNDPISDYSREIDTFDSKVPSGFPSDYNIHTTTDYGHAGQQTHTMSKVVHYPKYTEVGKEYDTSTSVYSKEPSEKNRFISKATSQFTNLASDYNNASPGHRYKDRAQYPLISNVIHYPEYTDVKKEYDEKTTVHGEEKDEQSYYMTKAKSEYTNIPSDYDTDYDVDPYPSLGPYNPNYPKYPEIEKDTETVEIIKSSPTKHLYVRPADLNVNYSNLKLAPSYRLFTISNLLKLHDAIIKIIEINGPSLYGDIALINLKKIINIILILAEHLGETAGSNKWYEKIFYIDPNNRHPLHLYAYNLLRQRWLHELMLLLHNNNFSFNILQNPGLFSFLGSWQFPKHVLHFLDAEELIEHNFYDPNSFDYRYIQDGVLDTFSAYDDVFANIPDDLENYSTHDLENFITHDVSNAYIPPDDDIVLGIAGIDTEPDANNIILMLQKYLLNKSFIEEHDNVINRDNMVKMLKKVIWFLKAKGYNAFTIADLIRKLYTAVYLTEGNDCQAHADHVNFINHIFDIIVSVLRSGR